MEHVVVKFRCRCNTSSILQWNFVAGAALGALPISAWSFELNKMAVLFWHRDIASCCGMSWNLMCFIPTSWKARTTAAMFSFMVMRFCLLKNVTMLSKSFSRACDYRWLANNSFWAVAPWASRACRVFWKPIDSIYFITPFPRLFSFPLTVYTSSNQHFQDKAFLWILWHLRYDIRQHKRWCNI